MRCHISTLLRSLLLVVVALGVLILNPFVACGTSPPSDKWTFGAKEMRAAVEGTWKLTLDDAPDRPIVFTVAQAGESRPHARRAGLVAAAAACGDRTLVRSAGACIDVTSMPLEIRVVSGLPVAALSGVFFVDGLSFSEGWLKVPFSGLELEARVTSLGEARDVEVLRRKAGGRLIRTN